MTEPATTARDMVAMLRRHYLPESKEPGGIFAPEIQAPGSSRRADLIWQGVTVIGRDLVGHEIKVTRADLLAELAEPAKADPWMRYCDRWYLVIPTMELAEGLELPPAWGVMTPPSGRRTRSMTVEVAAPKLTPDEQGPALRTLATWLHWRLHREQNQRRATERDAESLRTRLHGLQNDSRLLGPKSSQDTLVEQIVRGLGGYGDRLGDWSIDLHVEDVIGELKKLGTARATANRIQRQVSGYESRLKGIGDGCRQLIKEIGESA